MRPLKVTLLGALAVLAALTLSLEVHGQRLSSPPAQSPPLPSQCHEDCRTARQACLADCVDDNADAGTHPGHRGLLKACAAPCEGQARGCFNACDAQL